MEFIQEEIAKKFKSSAGSGKYALDSFHLAHTLDQKEGQDSIRAVDPETQYYFNEFSPIITK